MQFSVLKSSCGSLAWGSSATLNQCGICKSQSSKNRQSFVCPQLSSIFFPLPYRCDFLVLLITVIAQFLELHPAFHYATFVRSLKLLRYVQQDAVCNRGSLHDEGYTAVGCYVWSRGTGTLWKPLFCSWDQQLGKYSFTAMTVLHLLTNMLHFYQTVSHCWWWQCTTSLPLLEWKRFAIRSTHSAGMVTYTCTIMQLQYHSYRQQCKLVYIQCVRKVKRD